MNVKKYIGPTMQHALEEVKKDLGKDAVILHTKTHKRNGLFGMWGKEMVEITASKDIQIHDRPAIHNGQRKVMQKYADLTGGSSQPQSMASSERSGNHRSAHGGDVDIKILHSDLNEVKSLVLSILKRSKNADVSNLSDELLEAYLLLIEQEVTEEISKEIIHKIHNNLKGDEVKDRAAIKNCLNEAIMRMVRHVEPITLCEGRAKKVAFVGPTGVGKTTTIAKLAADFSLKGKKDIALITIDTYRIAAVEQLRTYADIINIPLEVVLSPSEVQNAIAKHQDRDLILIDTAGRSHKNAMQMLELKSFIEAIQPDETHLVLSTTVTYKSVQEILERFKSIAIDKVVFTKLDEAVSLGLILNVISKLNKTLSYVTTGQNVPDDISITDPQMLANLIIEGDL
jgi:flagellar biosynthesis protein FlhF